MKKLTALFAFGLLLTSSAMAVEVSVQPEISGKTYGDYKNAASFGAKVSAEALPYVPSQVVVSTGLNYASTSLKDASDVDVDLYTVPVTVGYKVAVNDKVVVTPNVGLEAVFVDSVADNTDAVLLTSGVEAAYVINANSQLVGSVGYSFGSNEVNGDKESLSGATFTGGYKYQF